jgi:hypothetical protein
VNLESAASNPAAATGRQCRRLGHLHQAERVAPKRPARILAARRDGQLHVVQAYEFAVPDLCHAPYVRMSGGAVYLPEPGNDVK